MGQLIGKKLWRAMQGMYFFWCPGCDGAHAFWTEDYYKEGGKGRPGGPKWTWNGSGDAPTTTPSIDVDSTHPARRCHFFLEDGKIKFQGDSHHALRGQTVDLPDWEDDWNEQHSVHT